MMKCSVKNYKKYQNFSSPDPSLNFIRTVKSLVLTFNLYKNITSKSSYFLLLSQANKSINICVDISIYSLDHSFEIQTFVSVAYLKKKKNGTNIHSVERIQNFIFLIYSCPISILLQNLVNFISTPPTPIPIPTLPGREILKQKLGNEQSQ